MFWTNCILFIPNVLTSVSREFTWQPLCSYYCWLTRCLYKLSSLLLKNILKPWRQQQALLLFFKMHNHIERVNSPTCLFFFFLESLMFWIKATKMYLINYMTILQAYRVSCSTAVFSVISHCFKYIISENWMAMTVVISINSRMITDSREGITTILALNTQIS